MKKNIGWGIIVLCSSFLIVILAAFSIILHSSFTNPEEIYPYPMTTTETVCIVFSSLVMIFLLIAGLVSGIKKVKKDKIVRIDYTDTLDINLTGKISYKDYRNLNLKLTFSNWVRIMLICVILLITFSFIIGGSTSNFIIFLGLICFPLIVVLIQSKRVYRTNKPLQEQLNYKLTNESVHIKGESFDSTQKWTTFYKMKETSVFFVFYQSVGSALLIDKRMFTDTELADFKQFIRSLNLKQ